MLRDGTRFTHEWIWRAIDTLASRQGLSPSGLARLAGLDATTFNRSKRFTPEGRPRWPSTESIAKLLKVTGTSLDEFANLEFDAAPPADSIVPFHAPLERIPLIGEVRNAAVGRLAGSSAETEAAGDRRSADIIRPIFAIVVADGSLEPVYSRGNRLIVSQAEEPRPGDRVVLKPSGGQPLPRLLMESTSSHLELASLQQADDRFAIRHTSVDWIGRIMWARQ
jgi:phage repressor protein C with HTH and peptisase S24 domain